MIRALGVCLALLGLCSCSGSGSAPPAPPRSAVAPPPTDPPQTTRARSQPAADGRLEIQLEIPPDVVLDRVPMRTALLGFRNVGSEPVRIYLPNGEMFRLGISSLSFVPESGRPHLVPDPHPHGYVVTEADFHLLAPGESRSFPQRFTIDPMVPGGGLESRRLPGFEPGRPIRVHWSFENRIRRWEGGRQTMEGPTKALFGGTDIPYIWIGELGVELAWTAPP